MVKRVFLLFFFLQLSLFGLDIEMGAKNAILINAHTGAILYEKNAYDPAYPASTTKIATALLVLQRANLESLATAKRDSVASISPQAKKQSNYRSPSHWIESDSTHVGIKAGEKLTINDLLHASLVRSANDASNILAQHVGGTIPKFMEQLNLYLKKIGCQKTHFTNPHGLHHPDHVTTAYDLALMAVEGLKNPTFASIVSKERYTIGETNLEHERYIKNTNRLIRSGSYFYPEAIGVKTGTTSDAGKNLVAAVERDGRVLIAVALGYSTHAALFTEVAALFDAALDETMMRRKLLPQGKQKFTCKVRGGRGKLKTYLPHGLNYDFYPSEGCEVKASIKWTLPKELPIAKHQQVAILQVVDERGTVLHKVPLLAHDTVKPTLLYTLKETKEGKRTFLFGGLAALAIFFWRLRRRRPRRYS